MDWEEIAYALRDKGINRRELRQKYHDLHKNGKNEKKKTDKAADETAGAIPEVPISRQMPSNGPNFVLGRSADKPTLRYARGEYEGIDDEKVCQFRPPIQDCNLADCASSHRFTMRTTPFELMKMPNG